MFDCYPAVSAAFKHTKMRAEVNLEEEKSQPAEDTAEVDKEEGKATKRNVENTLQFVEFRKFLQNLRLYFARVLWISVLHLQGASPVHL